MLTARGWWMTTLGGLVALLGVTVLARYTPTVALLGLSLFAWLLGEWIVFAYRFRTVVNNLVVTRIIEQRGRGVTSVWARSPFSVRITVTNPRGTVLTLAFLADRVPPGHAAIAGRETVAATLPANSTITIDYDLLAQGAGRLTFVGLSIRVTDHCGFFTNTAFLRADLDLPVLPPPIVRSKTHGDKRFNALPPPGSHRLRRPGGGSELLDLRDYQPGDPPKMIAWKASARRDKLITKELESDVPVRCVLFLDASNAVRIGEAGATPLAQLVAVAAAVAQSAAENRDLVGLTIFDERASTTIPPARTRVHTIRLLNELAVTAARLPDDPNPDGKVMSAHLEPLLNELHPDLLEPAANSRPWGLYWRPLLDRRRGWLILLPFLLTPLLIRQPGWLDLTAQAARHVNPGSGWLLLDVPLFLFAFLFVATLPSTLASLYWLFSGLRGFRNPSYRRTTQRKKLAAALAALDADAPTMIERYLKDDVAFSARAARFLAVHQVRVPLQCYDAAGQYRFRGEAKAAVLAAALVRAVAKARDNELYVILADLIEIAENLGPLVKALTVARGRHHQIMIVVPWPAGISTIIERRSETPRQFLEAAVADGYRRRFDEVLREMALLGIGVTRLHDGRPVQTILARLDRLHGSRGRR